jgi:hypothetical protein
VAKETHADPSGIAPWVAANAMLGLCRALVTHVRQQVLAGEHDRAHLARELRAQARQAAALLERGSVSSAAEEPARQKLSECGASYVWRASMWPRAALLRAHPTTSRASDRRAVPPVSERPAGGTSACAAWLSKAADDPREA